LRYGEDLKAIEALQKALPVDTLTIKEVYNKSGINGILNWLIELQLKESNPYPISLAEGYAKLGKKEESLNCLEKALQKKITTLPYINNDPDFDNVRSEPRFQAIIKKMGLSEYQKKE
jgi:tetratricopeptide (TPR) repeat protein